MFDLVKGTIRKEGYIGLYRGMVPSLAGVIPYVGEHRPPMH
jgi:hypothetical protein